MDYKIINLPPYVIFPIISGDKILLRQILSSDIINLIEISFYDAERITSNGNKGKIKVEIFKQAINKLLTDGSITRDYINQNYIGRASSGVILILSQVPFFQLTDRPSGLKYIK